MTREIKEVKKALEIIDQYGSVDGAHHKAWVIDQVVRALMGNESAYKSWVVRHRKGKDGPATYDWDIGIPP